MKPTTKVIIPAARYVDCSDLEGFEIEELPEKVEQLYLGTRMGYGFSEGVIKNLTHLFVEKINSIMSIPETLEHLFIRRQIGGYWPKVQNLYIEEQDVPHFLDSESPWRFHVFSVGNNPTGSLIPRYSKSMPCRLDAFNRTFLYYTFTRIETETIPRRTLNPSRIPNPHVGLSHSELVELNKTNIDAYFKNTLERISIMIFIRLVQREEVGVCSMSMPVTRRGKHY